MVIDADGYAHVAAQLGYDIYYVTNRSGSWTREQLTDAPRDTRFVSPLIDLDEDGSIGVAYSSKCRACAPDFPEATWFTSNASGQWSESQRVVEGGASHLGLHETTIHLLYTDTNGEGIDDLNDLSRLLYASSTEGETAVVELANIGDGHALRVSGDGAVQLVYKTWEPGGSDHKAIRYADRDAGGGEFGVSEVPLPEADYFVAAAIDGRRAHIVFSTGHVDAEAGEYSASPPMYIHQADGGWSDAAAFGEHLPTAIDVHHGTVHAVGGRFVGDSAEIWYTTNRGLESMDLGCCAFEGESDVTFPAVAVDSAGRPHLFYTTRDGTWYAVGPAG